ncbi:MAG TPA: helix-turn-helix transcriptional regulator [Anaerolineae bacterium]|nr:helix-turn-helix transcriptional regulator [Anaerolineae bacterium]
MHALIEAVCTHQEDTGLSDQRLAELLGIDGSTWSYIKAGKRAAGPKVLGSIARELPHLNHLIMDYITRTDNHNGQ